MYAADFAAGMAGAWLYARGVTIRGWMAAVAVVAAIAVLWASGAPTADAARLGARQSLWLAVATPAAFGALVLDRRGRPGLGGPTTAARAGSGRSPSASSSSTSW